MQSSENLLNFSATQIQRLRCFWYYLVLCRIQHILNEDAVPLGWICDEHVSYCSDELAVLDYGAARHECGQEGTTILTKNPQKAPPSLSDLP